MSLFWFTAAFVANALLFFFYVQPGCRLVTDYPRFHLSDHSLRALDDFTEIGLGKIGVYPLSLVTIVSTLRHKSYPTADLMVEAINIQLNMSCTIHLRVGDVLERKSHRNGRSMNTVLSLGTSHVFPIKHYENLSKTLFLAGYKRIVLVAGLHRNYGIAPRNTITYLKAVESAFSRFDVIRRYGQNPDEDFVFMAKSGCLVGGKGGYAQLIQKTASKYNAVIY